MSEVDLSTISITNFRSIRGRVAIPLQAPVVLLHGPNGAGKSTVMSALEVSLSGTVTGIGSAEQEHLVHRGAEKGSIDLLSSAPDVSFTIDREGIQGRPLLNEADARFLRERCYLRQRLLGQLLEFYEEAGRNGETRLTEFVKDLLGIDELEALINGLEPLRDKRLIKRLVPVYGDLEKQIKTDEEEVAALEAELELEKSEVIKAHTLFTNLVESPEMSVDFTDNPGALKTQLGKEGTVHEEQLVELLGLRREVASLARRADALQEGVGAEAITALEKAAANAGREATNWRDADGDALEDLLGALRKTLPGLPAAGGASDPEEIRVSALDAVDREIRRLEEAIDADTRGRVETGHAAEAIAAVNLRLEGMDAQLTDLPTGDTADELAKALAFLAPHVHTDECPVCGRDYSEVAGEPLSARLASRISSLGVQLERLQEATSARLDALSERRDLEEKMAATNRNQMEPASLLEAQSILTRLEDARHRLRELADGVAAGALLIRRQTEAERDLAVARKLDRSSVEMRAETERLAEALGQPLPSRVTSLPTAIAALSAHLAERVADLEDGTVKRARANGALDKGISATARQKDLESRLARRRATLRKAKEAAAELESRRTILRGVHDGAEAARGRMVRRVFNDNLNRAWRNLFVRLAPEEPFVPAFKVPDGRRRIEAKLHTVHRDGEPGGSPAAMLSAGNLNTAALTLFLALNLSVPQRLPWLLLDDPVQSMDEVHVAQFAALLRTLTHGHRRRWFS